MADERYIEEDPELDQGSEATEEDGEGAGLYEHFAVVADKGQTPLRLDKFLTVRMEKCSRNRIQAAADCGNILVNGKPAKSSYKVKPLDRIQIVMPYPRREVEIIPEDIPLEIPYEDDDLLIVNKPAGLVVHPGHGNYSGTLVNALTYHLRNLPLFQEGDMRAGLVHRIDKNTSGLLVVAKNEQAHARLAKQFFDHTIQRRYVALVWGNFDQDEGTITGNIGRSPRDRQKMFVFEDILLLDDRAIQRVLRDVDNNDLAVALKGANEQVQNAIFNNLSKRLVVMIKEDMEFMGPVRMKDVEEAQQKIVNIIRKLEDSGEIIISRGGGDEIVV